MTYLFECYEKSYVAMAIPKRRTVRFSYLEIKKNNYYQNGYFI